MKKAKNKLFYWLIPLPIIAIALIVFLNNTDRGFEINLPSRTDTNIRTTTEDEEQETEINDDINEEGDTEEGNELKLSVIPEKCRGCGKCMRTDPEHFEVEGDVATVISQENLDSAALASAIEGCPPQAIELN